MSVNGNYEFQILDISNYEFCFIKKFKLEISVQGCKDIWNREIWVNILGRDVQFAMKFRIVLPLHKDMTVVGAIGVTLLDYPVLRFGPEGLDWI